MDRVKRHGVYLAGAMTHTPDRGSSWRQEAKRVLGDRVEVFDPCELEAATMTCDEIVRADYGFILRSSAVLVFGGTPSWGTGMELAFARQHGVPVIGFGVAAGTRISPWLRAHCGFITHDMLVAIEHLLLILRETR